MLICRRYIVGNNILPWGCLTWRSSSPIMPLHTEESRGLTIVYAIRLPLHWLHRLMLTAEGLRIMHLYTFPLPVHLLSRCAHSGRCPSTCPLRPACYRNSRTPQSQLPYNKVLRPGLHQATFGGLHKALQRHSRVHAFKWPHIAALRWEPNIWEEGNVNWLQGLSKYLQHHKMGLYLPIKCNSANAKLPCAVCENSAVP